jgi:hypothetical protein
LSPNSRAQPFFTNTSATSRDVQRGHQLPKIALNLLDTLVPQFLRWFDDLLLAQHSAWGWLCEWFSQCYKMNLAFAFGRVAWLAVLRELFRIAREVPRRAGLFSNAFILDVTFLDLATHGARDRSLAAGSSPDHMLHSYNEPALMKLLGKIYNRLDFLGMFSHRRSHLWSSCSRQSSCWPAQAPPAPINHARSRHRRRHPCVQRAGGDARTVRAARRAVRCATRLRLARRARG